MRPLLGHGQGFKKKKYQSGVIVEHLLSPGRASHKEDWRRKGKQFQIKNILPGFSNWRISLAKVGTARYAVQ